MWKCNKGKALGDTQEAVGKPATGLCTAPSGPEETRPLGCPWFAGCSDSPVFMPLQPHFPIKEMYTQT